jgi:hypothetical protein
VIECRASHYPKYSSPISQCRLHVSNAFHLCFVVQFGRQCIFLSYIEWLSVLNEVTPYMHYCHVLRHILAVTILYLHSGTITWRFNTTTPLVPEFTIRLDPESVLPSQPIFLGSVLKVSSSLLFGLPSGRFSQRFLHQNSLWFPYHHHSVPMFSPSYPEFYCHQC